MGSPEKLDKKGPQTAIKQVRNDWSRGFGQFLQKEFGNVNLSGPTTTHPYQLADDGKVMGGRL
jgi:hypothetical protein